MITYGDADWGDDHQISGRAYHRERPKRIDEIFDDYIINDEKKFNKAGALETCVHYCGMQNKNTNYAAIEQKDNNDERKCRCYIIPGILFNFFVKSYILLNKLVRLVQRMSCSSRKVDLVYLKLFPNQPQKGEKVSS